MINEKTKLLLNIFLHKEKGLMIVIGTHKKNIETRAKWHINHLLQSDIYHYPQIHPAFTTNFPFDTNFTLILIPAIEFEKTKKLFQINVHIERMQTQIDAATSYKSAALYFLNNSNDDWLIRIDDDAGFYLPNLQKAIYRLNKFYDPNVPLVFGSIITLRKLNFLGGGGGYLFSRAGAELFLRHYDDWVRTMTVPNDVHMNQIINLFNMTFYDSSFPGMTSGFQRSFYDIMANNLKSQDFSKFKSYLPQNNSCIRGDKDFLFKNEEYVPNYYKNPSFIAYPLNDIFIYHHYWDLDKYGITWDKLIENGFPDNVYYYLCNWACHLCIPNEKHKNLYSTHNNNKKKQLRILKKMRNF